VFLCLSVALQVSQTGSAVSLALVFRFICNTPSFPKKCAFMKMHRILAVAASEIINAVFSEQKVLDRELAKTFESHPKWGKRDRSFIAETVFEVVRWRRALSFLTGSEETNALCAAQWLRMGFELPEWWIYAGADVDTIKARESELAQQHRAVRESIPDWLDALGAEELGDAWDGELAALNQRTCVYLRVNTLKSTRAEALAWLASYNIVANEVPGLPNALSLNPGKNLAKSLRLDGRVEIQDAGSQMIAPLLAPQPGECIIDTCAGAGGKSLHLAALMQNQGRIIGMDIVPRKLKELERRAKRAHPKPCIETKLISPKVLAGLAGVADRVLIDAPCSGLGTLKRQPDLKWRLKPAQLDRVRTIQAELLDAYSALLKPGGRLVFATCSVLPSENRANVDRLLSAGGFSLLEECTVSPAATGYDGFYAAALVKDSV
jgi:16S rRNA (cytosine967-C5)-methyltransferase